MQLTRRQFLGAAPSAAAVSSGSPVGPGPSADDDDPLAVRRDFPATGQLTYLNSAYIGPTPVPVVEAGRAFLEAKASRPISLGDMLARTDEVRGRFARFIGATEGEIGFLFATSEGENLVARALDLQPGDNIVVDELHYLTTFVLYKHLEETHGIELRIVKHRNGSVDVSDFEPRVDRRTRLVSVALVSHQNGFRHDLRPLADLAHARGALLYTDAIQAVGMFPIDVRSAGVDFLASGTYKWLLGGFGVAPFFVRRELLDRFPPDRYGALHVEKELGNYRYQLYRTAKKYDYATLAFGVVYQLGAALAYLERVGVERIEAHSVALAHLLQEGLADRGFRLLTPARNRSAIVSFHNPAAPDTARKMLADARIEVSFRENGRQIRVSPALFNNAAEIGRFLDVSQQLL